MLFSFVVLKKGIWLLVVHPVPESSFVAGTAMQATECRAVWSHTCRGIVFRTQPLQRTGKKDNSTVPDVQQCATVFAVAYTQPQLFRQGRGQIVTVIVVPILLWS